MSDEDKRLIVPERAAIKFSDEEVRWMDLDVAADILRGVIPVGDPEVSQGLFPWPHMWMEGIIGGGKSTATKEISLRLGMRPLFEPVAANPYLPDFYRAIDEGIKPNPYAFPMQMHLLGVRAHLQQMGASETTGLGGFRGAISDRSPAGDRVFCKMLVKTGDITPEEWRTYHLSYMRVCSNLLPPSKMFYLDCPPHVAYERIQRRGRECEKAITLEYLTALSDTYQELMHEAKRGLLPWGHAVEVIQIPWGRFAKNDELPDWDEIAENIKHMCKGEQFPLVPPEGPSQHVY